MIITTREVVECHRHVQPPHALERGIGGPARRLGLADRADAPGPVAAADPGGRVDGDLFAVDHDVPAPRTQLGEPLRVQRHPVAGAQDVALLLNDREECLPGQVAGDPLGLVEHDAQRLQRFDDLDAVAVDVLLQSVLVDGVGQMHRGLRVTQSDPVAAALGAISTNASFTPRFG